MPVNERFATPSTPNTDQNVLKIFHLNVQSLRSKQQILPPVLSLANARIVCLSEHWLHSGEHVTLDGYTLASVFSRTVRSTGRGGVAIYLTPDTGFSKNQSICDLAVELRAEVTAVDISNTKFTVVCMYRVPEDDVTTFLTTLEKVFHEINSRNRLGIICGDFNLNTLNPHGSTLDFIDCVNSNGFILTIDEPTRITNTSSTCIDNIMINFDAASITPECFNVGFSDHDAQMISITNQSLLPTSSLRETTEFCRMYKNSQINCFMSQLSSIPWDDVFADNDVNQNFHNFQTRVSQLYLLNFPLERKPKKKAKKIHPETVRALERLHDLNVLSRNFPQYKPLYHDLKQKLIIDCKNRKKSEIRNRLIKSKNLCKTSWEIIREFKGEVKQKKGIEKLQINGENTSDRHSMASELNSYFINSVSELVSKLNALVTTASFSPTPRVSESMVLFPTNEHEVESAIKALKRSSSAGVDEVPVRLIKDASATMLKPLVKLINDSFSSGVFPTCFKQAKVVPIYKKGSRNLASSYRPISILPSLSKVLEKIVDTRLKSFIKRNKILSESQFGFREGRSTSDACVSFLEKIIKILDKGEKACTVFCDLSRAFDTLDHGLLLEKLERYGIRGPANEWFKSYLSNRSQQVDVGGMGGQSGFIPIETGVAQGGMISPTLFLLYINELAREVSLASEQPFVSLFADDTAILLKAQNNVDLVRNGNNVLKRTSLWLGENKLFLNNLKTQFIVHIRRRSDDIPSSLEIDGVPITGVESASFLGVIFDAKLTWQPHIHALCSKLSPLAYLISTMSYYVDRPILLNIYHGLFESRLRYGIVCWGNSSEVSRPFRLQKKAIRALCGIQDQMQSCKPLFVSLGILTLPALYIFELLVYTFRHLNNYRRVDDVHNVNTRSRGNLYVEAFRLSSTAKGPTATGIKLFNKLPREFKDEQLSIGSFKTRLKAHLLAKCPYSLSEYLDSRV